MTLESSILVRRAADHPRAGAFRTGKLDFPMTGAEACLASVDGEADDEGYGMRVFNVFDPNGDRRCVGQGVG